MKTEERNHVVQIFQPYIPPNIQTPPSFQDPPFVPNPPRQIAARFAPLALPAVLHDLPQNYAHEILFYDGDGNFTARQHVDRFDDYVDLELVDEDDINMRLFVLSLLGEAKKWFRYLPARSIVTFEAFQTSFLERWDDKKIPLQVISQYNNLKKGGFESVHEFSSQFKRVDNSIPANIKPLVGAAKFHYVDAFDGDFVLLLRERK